MILNAVTSAVFRSINAPQIPLVITIAAVVLNTALRLVLVLGLGPIPSLGVAGVGLAIKALGVTLTKLLGLRALRVQTETVRLQHQRAAKPQVSSQIKTFVEYRRGRWLDFHPGPRHRARATSYRTITWG
jgi:Na+-driven multidrug efflux pump